MIRIRVALALSATLAAVAVPVATSQGATSKLYAFLDGKFETSPGDTDGHARIGLTFDRTRGRVCFDLRKFKLETPSGAHIHMGAKGKDGPMLIALFTKPTGAGKGKVTGCVNGVPRPKIDAVLTKPSGYYVNVHTPKLPKGSVRGQLTTRKLV